MKCAWCDRPSHIKQGRILLCALHYRMSSMRTRAKRDGKLVPSYAELEAAVPDDMVCAPCRRVMTWLRDQGASIQITLQHDRAGGFRFLCLGCNTRHGTHPGDTFYDLPKGSKRCPDCKSIKPISDFSVDRSRPIGRKSYCRGCASERHKEWRAVS